MMPGLAPCPPDSGAAGLSLKDMIQSAGLLTGLQLCLDPADINSYTGSGNFLDTSGNGNNYQPLTGASGGDPTFNGTPGGLSDVEYFTDDGTQFPCFTETAAQTFAEAYHKNNAVLSFLGTVYLPSPTATAFHYVDLWRDCTSYLSQIGVRFGVGHEDDDKWYGRFVVGSGGFTAVLNSTLSTDLTASIVENGWNVVGMVENEPAGTLSFYVNGTMYAAPTGTYSSPTTTSPGTAANSVWTRTSGTLVNRYGPLANWNVALTEANLDAIYALLKARYAGLP